MYLSWGAMSVGGYRIIYQVLVDEVKILTVHHGARLLGAFQPPNPN